MLLDILASNLIVVFVGTSKSTTSARAGHYYSNPQNMFWNLLEATGLTSGTWIGPTSDRTLPQHGVGLTDLVPARAASSDALLKSSDYDVAGFIAKIEEYAPTAVAFNGEGGHEGSPTLQAAQSRRRTLRLPHRRYAGLPAALLVKRARHRRIHSQARQVGRVRAMGPAATRGRGLGVMTRCLTRARPDQRPDKTSNAVSITRP